MTTKIKYFTKEEAIKAVIKDGYDLEFCAPELQNSEDVVMAAVKKTSLAFQYTSNELKSNKTFILKALNDGIIPWGLVEYANISIQSDLEVLTLFLEKSDDGWEFRYAKGEVALNKELAAKALVKWGTYRGSNNFVLWDNLHPILQELFPKDSFYKKAQSYLIQLDQEKQAKMVAGGSTTEDAVVW